LFARQWTSRAAFLYIATAMVRVPVQRNVMLLQIKALSIKLPIKISAFCTAMPQRMFFRNQSQEPCQSKQAKPKLD
jgi:hypothetical protein